MNRHIELALKKQRLLLRSAALRGDLAGHAAAFAPVFAAGDTVCAGVRWLRRNPAATVAVGVAVAVARPRAVFRWLRRGFVVWQAWVRAGRWLDDCYRAR